ncbi:hypothetical protein M6KS0526p2_2719 [Staphylococcus aureus]|nr:hypothetical protein M6KS0526p2_2719 [Staphylococcus aureus]
MIFFMVEKRRLFNRKFLACASCGQNITNFPLRNNQDNIIIIDNNNKPDPKDQTPKYIKIYINNPFNNRDIILKVAKNQKGIYI